MTTRSSFRPSFLLLAWSLTGSLLCDEDPRTASDLVRRSGVQGGLVVHVGCGDGRFTALDGATGKTLRTYAGTDNTHEIVARGGKLFLVISDRLDEESPTTGRVLRRFEDWRGAYSEFVTRYMPKHLRVVDAETGSTSGRPTGGCTACEPATAPSPGGSAWRPRTGRSSRTISSSPPGRCTATC